MTLLQKIGWFLIIFFVSYILSIFKAPILASAIEKVLWIEWFNEFILSFKSTYDDAVTNMPTKDELKNAYNVVHSWAVEFWENFEIWVDYTKKQIDWIRETLSWAENTYNDITDWYLKTKDYINTNSWVLQDVRDTIESFSGITESLTNSGIITWIQDTIETVTDLADEYIWTGTTE